jgi:hypothetical protein
LEEVDMHPSRLFLLAATVLAGCAVNPKIQGTEPMGPPAMRVSIGYPVGSSPIYPIFVNRDAYVAMFEIVPGRGATLVYPNRSGQVFVSDMHYADLTIQPARMFYHTDPFSLARFQPTYYYAIASTAPLNLTRMHVSLGSVRKVLGQLYGSYRPYDVIDKLTQLVVPMQPDEDWATDLLVDWPTPSAIPRILLAQRLVQCANGRVLLVAANYPYYGCPGDTQLAVAPADTTRPAKELPFDLIPRPPRGGKPEGIELSAPDVEGRRRAEAGARPPQSGRPDRGGREGIRYSDDNARRISPPVDSRSGSPGSRATSREEPRSVERSEPRARPAPERSEPRAETPARGGEKERKP